MAALRVCLALLLIALLYAPAASAQEQPFPGIYDRPVLVVDLGVHSGRIRSASADRAGRWVVTGAHDKTVRVWSLAEGRLERTIRLPVGPGFIGTTLAVAMSPDGALIAAGGWMNTVKKAGDRNNIYLFDRDKGILVRRIEVPRIVRALVFSPDGSRLAVGLDLGGMRVYAKERDWDEVAQDQDYENADGVYGVDFAPDGRLITACAGDGKVRLYAPDLAGTVRPAVIVEVPGEQKPLRIAFRPADGAQVALGYGGVGKVSVLDGRTLAMLASPDIGSVEAQSLGVVTWSRDGATLFAGGHRAPVLAWSQASEGAPRVLYYPPNTVNSILGLTGGDLLVAAGRQLARIGTDGEKRWVQEAQLADFRNQHDLLTVSADGKRVGFGFEKGGKSPAYFDVAKRTLNFGPRQDLEMTTPRQTGLLVQDWWTENPKIDGQPLAMHPFDRSNSLAIHPSGKSFVLGTGWSLNAYDAHGAPLWFRSAPGAEAVQAVNITRDGRLVVAAYGDGTIRWHRMEDGQELLALLPLPDRANWVAWTPEGFYAATAGAQVVLRWHVNRGWQLAESVPVEDIPGSYRPEVLPLVLQELETPRALGLAVLAEHNKQVMLRTRSHVSPGSQLHLLTIGIDRYNEEYAKNLRLKFAARDARDLASAIINTQDALYHVKPTVLVDKDANKKGILQALDDMETAMTRGGGNDLAVIHFSGHGALVDGKLYLLPYEVDSRSNAGIKSDGLAVEELRAELAELGRHGRVLVLLDACHSGATTTNGSPLSMDSTTLRTALAAANVSVLTSSTGPEVSYETPELEHGAFTKALLDAFDDPAADINRNGLISPTGLANYIGSRVPMLTGDRKHPGMEVRYDTTLFARSR